MLKLTDGRCKSLTTQGQRKLDEPRIARQHYPEAMPINVIRETRIIVLEKQDPGIDVVGEIKDILIMIVGCRKQICFAIFRGLKYIFHDLPTSFEDWVIKL